MSWGTDEAAPLGATAYLPMPLVRAGERYVMARLARPVAWGDAPNGIGLSWALGGDVVARVPMPTESAAFELPAWFDPAVAQVESTPGGGVRVRQGDQVADMVPQFWRPGSTRQAWVVVATPDAARQQLVVNAEARDWAEHHGWARAVDALAARWAGVRDAGRLDDQVTPVHGTARDVPEPDWFDRTGRLVRKALAKVVKVAGLGALAVGLVWAWRRR